ncbi:MAG: hypothetical protein S4CHLAM81_13470 [Chlamydiales bacterium]|nr:hypothetical protein [Chlamydiales bacterium]
MILRYNMCMTLPCGFSNWLTPNSSSSKGFQKALTTVQAVSILALLIIGTLAIAGKINTQPATIGHSVSFLSWLTFASCCFSDPKNERLKTFNPVLGMGVLAMLAPAFFGGGLAVRNAVSVKTVGWLAASSSLLVSSTLLCARNSNFRFVGCWETPLDARKKQKNLDYQLESARQRLSRDISDDLYGQFKSRVLDPNSCATTLRKGLDDRRLKLALHPDRNHQRAEEAGTLFTIFNLARSSLF